MSEERIKVLEMLKEGVISTEDALKLLEGLEKSADNAPQGNGRRRENDGTQGQQYYNHHGEPHESQNRREHHHVHMGHEQRYRGGNYMDEMDLNWINELKDNIVESVQNVAGQFDSSFGMPMDFGRPMLTYTDSVEDAGDFINSIKLLGKNNMVEVIATEGSGIFIEAFFKPKNYQDPHVLFEKNNGNYSLTYDYNAVSSMRIRLTVPRVKIGNLHAETKNSSIYVRDVEADTGIILTKNAQVQLDNVSATYLNLETRNAAIFINNTTASDIDAKTSNGMVFVNSVDCENLNAQTSNGQIKFASSDVRHILAKTTNAAIKLESMADITRTQWPFYSAELYTSNGTILTDYINSMDVGLKVNAATTFGRINCSRSDLLYNTSDKNYIDAMSNGYEQAQHKLSIKANTSSGNVNIC